MQSHRLFFMDLHVNHVMVIRDLTYPFQFIIRDLLLLSVNQGLNFE